MVKPANKVRDFTTELTFIASRSSGPGGQNVNKVSTRVELRFNVLESVLLTQDEKQVILDKLKNRINSEGIMKLFSHSERTQLKNKKKVVERFYHIIDQALKPSKKRRPTQPPEKSKEKRILEKRMISEKKERRKPVE